MTLDQARAANALARVRALQRDGDYGNYRSYVERLPAQIVMNGLGQAVALVKSRCRSKPGGGDDTDPRAYRRLYEDIDTWLRRDHEAAPYRGQDDLLTALTTCDQDTYVRAHAETLAYLDWLKKFACAFLDRGKEST
ncbi:type III-B CRISPR module-associated protein Cmr5 [Haliangium sp.]|uniref:type III-B CRISPR module-associated protein Cmr5 n=1 Tax=Haliangium sp. TaxID=2663208 RepID=UPI003D09F068